MSKFWTTGDISRHLDIPLQNTIYWVNRLGVQPENRCGIVKMFDPKTARFIMNEIRRRSRREIA